MLSERPVRYANLTPVYGEYAKANNLAAVAVYLIALVAAQTAQIGKFLTLCLGRRPRWAMSAGHIALPLPLSPFASFFTASSTTIIDLVCL